MRIFETKTQFIKEEEGIKAPEGVLTYDITFTADMNSAFRMEFPQYELFFRASGGWGYSSYLELNYRGLVLGPKSGENREVFILNLINNLKKGNYVKKMNVYFKDRLSEEDYKNYKSVLNTNNPKIKQLENEVISLKETIDELKNNEKDAFITQIQEENERLQNKIDKLRKLLE